MADKDKSINSYHHAVKLVTSVFAEERSGILYRPDLVKAIGGVTSAILLQQAMYWWKQSGFKSFYKFKEPCGHSLYREGDSWCEELAFSRSEFDTAIQRIGVKKLKDMSIEEAVSQSTSEDKPVVYWIDGGRVTHYDINPAALITILERAYLKQETDFSKSEKVTLAKAENSLLLKQESSDTNTETTRDQPETSAQTPASAEKSTVIPADPLVAMFEFATREQKPQRPRGWEDASEGEFAVCKRVVDLWCAGKLPTGEWGDRIDLFCKGANALLGYHDGDLQACLLTIDRYHEQFDGGFTVSGPQSLVNVIPPFLAGQGGSGTGTGSSGNGQKRKGSSDRHQRGRHRREYEPCTEAERQAAWEKHGEWIREFMTNKREELGWRFEPSHFQAEIGQRLKLGERQVQALCEAFVVWEAETAEPLDVEAVLGVET